MIRSNLSTRPFYNSRAVNLWLALIAGVVVLATAFNVSRVVRYSGSNTELALQAEQDEMTAEQMRARASTLRASLDARQIETASTDARQANQLIDRRTLSWTELFNRFEATLPPDVRITSVRPEVDQDQQITLLIVVIGRSVDDVDTFMKQLDATGAFSDVRSVRERTTESGQIESQLEMGYVPYPEPPPATLPAAAPAGGAR